MIYRHNWAETIEQGLDGFINMVQKNNFADAHETLEASWKAMRSEHPDEAKILKGLINGATALELKKRGRSDAAMRVWRTFEKYRPLIATVHSAFREKYYKCEKVLQEKRKNTF